MLTHWICLARFCTSIRPLWARECCRISPPRFLTECRKKRLKQRSFVLLYFALFVFRVESSGPSVRPSTESFSDLNIIWYVGRGQSDAQWYAIWPDPRSRLWMSHSSAGNHVIKRLMVNCDTPRQYLNFNQTDFCYSSSFITWPSNLWCSTFGKQFLPLTSTVE